jgi:hypothetical protein
MAVATTAEAGLVIATRPSIAVSQHAMMYGVDLRTIVMSLFARRNEITYFVCSLRLKQELCLAMLVEQEEAFEL